MERDLLAFAVILGHKFAEAELNNCVLYPQTPCLSPALALRLLPGLEDANLHRTHGRGSVGRVFGA